MPTLLEFDAGPNGFVPLLSVIFRESFGTTSQMLYEPSCHPINPYQSLYIPIISVQHIARHDGAPGLSPKVAVEVGRLEHIMGKKGHPCRHQDPKWDRIALWKFKRHFKSPQQHSEASARSIPDSGKCGV